MPFEITAIRENQQPSKDAPFHEDGGDWTFFDCHAVTDSDVVFTIGVKSNAATGNAPIAWGQAMMIVKDDVVVGRTMPSRTNMTTASG
jgi:hypothetical protein